MKEKGEKKGMTKGEGYIQTDQHYFNEIRLIMKENNVIGLVY